MAIEPAANRPYNADSLQPKRLQLQGLCGLRQETIRKTLALYLTPDKFRKTTFQFCCFYYIRQFWSEFKSKRQNRDFARIT